MMMNRRNALLTAAAMAAGSVGSFSIAKAGAPKLLDAGNQRDGHSVAKITRQFSAKCAEAITALPLRPLPERSWLQQLIDACRDCRDICNATAQGNAPMNPALRQACADACSRVVESIRASPESQRLRQLEASATRCADVCRRSIA